MQIRTKSTKRTTVKALCREHQSLKTLKQGHLRLTYRDYATSSMTQKRLKYEDGFAAVRVVNVATASTLQPSWNVPWLAFHLPTGVLSKLSLYACNNLQNNVL
jgi:hypothetical protein